MYCSPLNQVAPTRQQALKFSAKYFLDTEFNLRGGKGIDLISIGIAANDGREFYEESKEFAPASVNRFVKQNVLPHLRPVKERKPNVAIQKGIRQFVGSDPKPEFYAKNGSQDFKLLCQLFGGVEKLPANFPKEYVDFEEICKIIPEGIKAVIRKGVPHHALEDARWLKKMYDWLECHQADKLRKAEQNARKPLEPPDKKVKQQSSSTRTSRIPMFISSRKRS